MACNRLNGKIILLIAIIAFCGKGFAIKEENTHTDIFEPSFRTLKIEKEGDFMSPPVISLGSNEKIIISFDEIAEDNRYLSARLIHCNSDWQPSKLIESEYLQGFNTVDIDDFAYSNNTFIHYVNYRLEIPSEGFVPIVSGNYLIQIYDRDAPEEILLQARFRIVEEKVGVTGEVSTRTDRGVNDRWQQLSLKINTEGFEIGNPYQDLKVIVTQNNRESTSKAFQTPMRISGAHLIYEHLPELIFSASNEYRRFEMTSVLFPGMGVDSVKYGENNYHIWVKPDFPRLDSNYEYDRTQHGRYLIKEYNATDSNIGADYVTVHFFLDTPELQDMNIYLDGEVTHDRYDTRNLLKYNGEKGGYELTIPLKQGAYNYQYVAKRKEGEKKTGESTESLIEGDKYETDNEYNVYVYSHCPGDRFDSLIGYATISLR
ncbi:MAG: DUF5103 domain-containing protein [Muribaculaceae bacterium]|nr:DUF5103 domain-containing protein [Muribaculaceae bacterium]